jgi:hypothetical protein
VSARIRLAWAIQFFQARVVLYECDASSLVGPVIRLYSYTQTWRYDRLAPQCEATICVL